MDILTAVLVVAVIGAVAGIGLSVASVVMAVPVDEKAEKIREVLPGANCGACGYSGCDAYAKALADGAKTITLCAPGGADVAQKIGEILGVQAGEIKAKSAVVRCKGNCDNVSNNFVYDGIESCAMAAQLSGGPSACKYGCIGLGDCVKACEYGAIKVCNGVAVVDKSLCKACKKCVAACPKGLIKVVDVSEPKPYVYCMNNDKGAVTRKDCKAGCIGCMKCKKVCENDAIEVTNNLARIHLSRCVNCGKCIEVCPNHCIEKII